MQRQTTCQTVSISANRLLRRRISLGHPSPSSIRYIDVLRYICYPSNRADGGPMITRIVSLERRCCDDGCMATVAGTHFHETEVREQTPTPAPPGDEIRPEMIRPLA